MRPSPFKVRGVVDEVLDLHRVEAAGAHPPFGRGHLRDALAAALGSDLGGEEQIVARRLGDHPVVLVTRTTEGERGCFAATALRIP